MKEQHYHSQATNNDIHQEVFPLGKSIHLGQRILQLVKICLLPGKIPKFR